MNNQQFFAHIKAVCEEHGLHEIVLYVRTAQSVNTDGELVPAQPVMAFDNDPILLEESVYYIEQERLKLHQAK